MSQRQPRKFNDAHLRFIRGLPCIICGNNIQTEAAHIRMPDLSVAKPLTGIGIKPDDKYTIPLCWQHHREQHEISERKFWTRFGIDPVKKALALYAVSGDQEIGEKIAASVSN